MSSLENLIALIIYINAIFIILKFKNEGSEIKEKLIRAGIRDHEGHLPEIINNKNGVLVLNTSTIPLSVFKKSQEVLEQVFGFYITNISRGEKPDEILIKYTKTPIPDYIPFDENLFHLITQELPPFSLLLGFSGQNYLFSSLDEEVPMILLAGLSGSGKTTALFTLLSSLKLSSNNHIELFGIDYKYTELKKFLPMFEDIVYNDEEVYKLTKTLYDEMERRLKGDYQPGIRKIMVIDEYADMAQSGKNYCKKNKLDPSIEDYVCSIARRGRSCGIHLLISTQRPEKAVLTGQIRDNMSLKIALMCSTDAQSIMIIGTGRATELDCRGRAIVQIGSALNEYKVQFPIITHEYKEKILEYVLEQES